MSKKGKNGSKRDCERERKAYLVDVVTGDTFEIQEWRYDKKDTIMYCKANMSRTKDNEETQTFSFLPSSYLCDTQNTGYIT